MEQGQVFTPYKKFSRNIFIPNSLLSFQGLSSTAILCWGLLAQYAGKNGECFPSQNRLSKDLGISLSQIKRVLQELEEKGLIKKEHPKGIGRLAHKTVRYKFLWNEAFEVYPKNVPDNTSQGIAIDTSGGVADDTSLVRVLKEKKKKKILSIEEVIIPSEEEDKIKKEADEKITKEAMNFTENASYCSNTSCVDYFKCTEERDIQNVRSCSKLFEYFKNNYCAAWAERLIAEKLEEYKEKVINAEPESKVKHIILTFIKQVKKEKSINYRINKPWDYDAVVNYIHMPDVPNPKDLIDFYLDPYQCYKSKKHVSLSTCLSSDTINMYEMNKR